VIDRKIGATGCQILTLKCIKFDFRRGSPSLRLGSLLRSPDSLAVFKVTYFYGDGGKEKERERRVRENGIKGRTTLRNTHPPVANSWLRNCF